MENELEATYSAMSDDEMQELGGQYASLTDAAQSLVRAEFKRRGLETPTVEEEEPPLIEVESLTVIRQYRDQAEALMARSVLESAGISSYLLDEFTVGIAWQYSNAIGGIKLQVAERDVEAAEAAFAQLIPASFEVIGGPDYYQPKCPKCGSLDSELNSQITGLKTIGLKAGMVETLLFGFALPRPVYSDYWKCKECGTNWVDESEPDEEPELSSRLSSLLNKEKDPG